LHWWCRGTGVLRLCPWPLLQCRVKFDCRCELHCRKFLSRGCRYCVSLYMLCGLLLPDCEFQFCGCCVHTRQLLRWW
jgi:hypothetical protein